MKPNTEEIITLLQQLIATESFSKKEDKTADILDLFLKNKGIASNRVLNNVWAVNKHYHPSKPTILLNSHHDTVRPNKGYSRGPFTPLLEDGKLFGLGSNDAGGPLVSLLACFLNFYDRPDLKFNLLFAATAEEEISGKNGIEALLPHLGVIDFGVVGEPTSMNVAIAEKGLMVLDCISKGVSGHAAREEGENAIYNALKDIEWFRNFKFPKTSDLLGTIKMTVTLIQAGTQHNVVPDTCHYTVDVRTTDAYTNEETLSIIREHITSSVHARSLRLNPSFVAGDHPLVRAGKLVGATLYGSPTLSDQALMNFPTFKMGPGDSARSHSADEFIFIHELEEAVDLYIQLFSHFNSLL